MPARFFFRRKDSAGKSGKGKRRVWDSRGAAVPHLADGAIDNPISYSTATVSSAAGPRKADSDRIVASQVSRA